VECCSNQMVPGSLSGSRILACLRALSTCTSQQWLHCEGTNTVRGRDSPHIPPPWFSEAQNLVCQPVPPRAGTPKRPLQDSNLQPLVPKTPALSIRPQGCCLLATRPHEPALGELPPALGRQRGPSRKKEMQDRPQRADEEGGICFSRQAPCEENT
jgi:hypothetical protein